MKTEQQYFDEALPMHDYIAQMDVPFLKEGTEKIYNQFDVPNDGFAERLAGHKILAITENWCGDAMLNNPIMLKIAEAAGIEMRAAFRDADTDLIDNYLTNGGRAIPIYLVLNEAGEVVAKWGPRAPELQLLVVNGRAELPPKEDESYAAAEKALYGGLQQKYIAESQCWSWVYEDIKRVVTAAL